MTASHLARCQLVCCVLCVSVPGLAGDVKQVADRQPVKPLSLADEMPRIPATDAGSALKTFQLQQGFQIELVAAEPDVSDPVAACFDESGRMFVAEMHGYPYSQEPTRLNPKGGGKPDAGIVRLLEDTDGDGRMDRSVVFADQIRWPTSVCCYNGGVFVLAPPTLWWFKDSDGDGQADIRRRVFEGLNRDNVQAVANNMKWGLDHRIYVAGGRNPSVITQDGKQLLKLGRIDFSFDPLTETVRPETGGVQFGHCFDDWGNRFVCSNSNHIQHIVVPYGYTSHETWSGPAAIRSIALEGAAAPVFRRSQAEPWRIVRTRRRVADPKYARLPPTEKVPIGFFTSATSVTIYRGDAWPGKYRGQAFIGDVGGNLVHRKILEPDGVTFKARRADQNCEFLASTDNWFRPTNFVNAPDGTLYMLDMYRETIEHPYSIPEDIKAHLDLQSGSDRGRVYRLLADNGIRKPVEKLGGLSANELVQRLGSKNAWIRETAHRLLWEHGDRESEPAVRELLNSKEPLAQLHAMYSLEGLPNRLTVEELESKVHQPHVGVAWNAFRIANSRQLALKIGWGANPPDPRVLFELCFHKPDRIQSLGGHLTALLRSSDPYVAAGGRGIVLATPVLTVAALKDPETRDLVASALDGSTASAGWNDQELEALAEIANDENVGVQTKLHIAEAIRVHRRGNAVADSKFLPVFLSEHRASFRRAMRNAALPDSKRGNAIRLLGYGTAEDLDALLAILSPSTSDGLQAAAVLSIFKYSTLTEKQHPRDRKIMARIIEIWPTMSPTVRKSVVSAFLSDVLHTRRLLAAIRQGDISGRDLDAESKKFLAGHGVSEIAVEARKLLQPEPTAARKEVLVKYRPALDVEGVVAKGRELFLKKCSICHKVGNQGHLVAPEIVSVVNKSPDDLLIAILDPNREAQPNFTQYTVITKAGRVYTGMIAAESGVSLTLRRAEGKQDVIRRADIDQLVSTGRSLMPEGFEKDLSPEQIRDIIAFVKSLGVKQK